MQIADKMTHCQCKSKCENINVWGYPCVWTVFPPQIRDESVPLPLASYLYVWILTRSNFVLSINHGVTYLSLFQSITTGTPAKGYSLHFSLIIVVAGLGVGVLGCVFWGQRCLDNCVWVLRCRFIWVFFGGCCSWYKLWIEVVPLPLWVYSVIIH